MERMQPVKAFDAIMAIRQRLWLMLACSVIVFIVSFVFFKYRLNRYCSTVALLVSEVGSEEDKPANLALKEPGLESETLSRVMQLAKSTRMINHLINKFDLYTHYGINKGKEFYYERTYAIIENSIRVSTEFTQVNITVSDAHRYLAAEMANEIAAYLEILNKELTLNTIQKKLDMYNILVADLEQVQKGQVAKFEAAMNELKSIPSDFLKKSSDSRLKTLESEIFETVVQLKNSTGELAQARKNQEFALTIIKDQSLQTVTVTRKALADFRSNALTSMLLSVLPVVLLWLGVLFITYIFMYYRPYILKLIYNP